MIAVDRIGGGNFFMFADDKEMGVGSWLQVV